MTEAEAMTTLFMTGFSFGMIFGMCVVFAALIINGEARR